MGSIAHRRRYAATNKPIPLHISRRQTSSSAQHPLSKILVDLFDTSGSLCLWNKSLVLAGNVWSARHTAIISKAVLSSNGVEVVELAVLSAGSKCSGMASAYTYFNILFVK